MNKARRAPKLDDLYQKYLVNQDIGLFGVKTSRHYTAGSLERLSVMGDRLTRRAAVLALGLIADYSSNAAMGHALTDGDRGVRMLADTGIRQVWCRIGSPDERQQLADVIRLNGLNRFVEAGSRAGQLIDRACWLAEAWNQRAIAHYGLGLYAKSAADCTQTLEINPYHFGAASGLGQCHLRLGNRAAALSAFRRALAINPDLEGVRAQVVHLQRTLKGQD